MIKTKYSSIVSIIGPFPSHRSQCPKTLYVHVYKRVMVEFHRTGYQTWINIIDLVESKPNEINDAIDKIKRKEVRKSKDCVSIENECP